MYDVYTSVNKRDLMGSVLKAFALSLCLAVIGMLIGTMVPPALFMPLMVVEFIMILSAFLLRKKKALDMDFYLPLRSFQGLQLIR